MKWGWYSPVHVRIQIGDEMAWGTHETAIFVWNNVSDSDGYNVRLEPRNWGNSNHGLLFGLELRLLFVLIVDTDENMLESGQLPLTPDFARSSLRNFVWI